jgi:hypothetical protein
MANTTIPSELIADGAITSAKLDTNIAVGGTLNVSGDANFDSNTLFVDASANAVGIGTTSPDAMLRIDQDNVATGLKVTGGNGGVPLAEFTRDIGGTGTVEINANGGDPQIKFASAGNTFSVGVNSNTFEIADNDALGTNARFTINSTGNVGIGTTSPFSKLHVGSRGSASVLSYGSSSDGIVFDFYNLAGSPYTRYANIVSSSSDTSESRLGLWTQAASGTSSQKLTILGDGNVGIGTTSPSKNLHISSTLTESLVEGTNNSVSALVAGVSVKAHFYRKAGFTIYDESDAEHFFIGRPYAGVNTFDISNRGTSRLRIDSTGLVGIGTTSPTTPLHVYHATTDTVANFQSGDNTVAVNFTALDNSMQIATSSTDGIIKNNGAGSFRLFNNGSERARIDSSGNLFVGKTASSLDTTGIQLQNDGLIRATKNNADVLQLNRQSSDGAIVNFYKDGTSVGSIGVANANNLVIESTSTDHIGLEFGNDILPRRNAAVVDNQTNLGTSSYRFANLHSSNILASSVAIGTTSPANSLHQHKSDSGATYHSFTNSTTGATSTDGFIIGLGASEEATLWNYENTHIRFATNNAERLRIDSSGNLLVDKTAIGFKYCWI